MRALSDLEGPLKLRERLLGPREGSLKPRRPSWTKKGSVRTSDLERVVLDLKRAL